ncbi:MAG: hypothetical protein EOP92_16690 [Lysobacteraceae bacterium]|nr:MAG: hypothetical protein EOP92_16690 [Xanthomonadaceae bacterium]
MRHAQVPVFPCDICGTRCKAGAGVHGFQRIPGYDLIVCRNCFQTNHDGWAPMHEEAFENHLALKDIRLPARNAQGWYPREP